MFDEILPFKIQDKSIILFIRATPKAASNRIGPTILTTEGNNCLKIFVTDPPEAGRANKAIIELLAKKIGISKSSITIIKGIADKNKTLEIKGEIPQIEKILKLLV